MDGGLKKFRLARFELHLQAKDTLLLPPYKGSTLRGGFGHAFKKTACPFRCKPASCLLPKVCVYTYVFETPPPEGSEILRKYPHAPHPFVIEPPLDEREVFQPGEELRFGLVLIGKALDYLPYFIYSFDELGRIGIGRRKGKYEVTAVLGVGQDGKGRRIYDGPTKTLINTYPILTGDDLLQLGPLPTPNSQLPLLFLTPTRLKYEANLTSDLEFHILIRNLLRRISTMSYFHCGTRLELDFKGLIERAKRVKVIKSDLRWADWERYSNRQQGRIKMGGFVGRISFEGKYDEFMPLLRLGELVHVGKGTVFGLGQYRIVGGTEGITFPEGISGGGRA